MPIATPANLALPGSRTAPSTRGVATATAFPGALAISTDIKAVLSRGSPAGTTKLIQGMTQTQHTLDTFAANNPNAGAGNRNTDVLNLVTALTSGSQAPIVYNVHIYGFGTTNPWAHPPAAVAAYQVAAGHWTGTFANQENPYFYNSGTANSGGTPIVSPDVGPVSNNPSGSSNAQTAGMDVRCDTATLLGAVLCITLCMCPDWMTSGFTTNADYAHFNKLPPLSTLATDNTTILAHSSGVPAELLTLSATVGAADHGNQPDGHRGLYFIDYWRFLVKQAVRRYCLPTSAYILGTSGTINAANTPCTIIQVWNEFGGLDFPTGTVGANAFGDAHVNEEVTAGVTNRTNNWDWAQYAWLYGHTYAAIGEVMTENSTTRAALGLKLAGPYVPLRWNYYSPTSGVARATPPVLDTDSTYYRLQHGDQVIIANWLMFRSGTGNAYPTPGPGITQRSGTVPQWTPWSSGRDKGVAQNILAYDTDLLCFDGLQRRSSDPIGLAVSSLPDQLEPARTAAQWMAQVLADTPRYATVYADMAKLVTNCGKTGLPIVQSENYSDVTLNSNAPVSGLETTTGTNHQYYATHAWVCAQTASQWLNMAKGGGSYVLRWQPEGVAFLNKNQLPDTIAAGTYYPAWSYDGDQQSLWYDGRNLATAGITPLGTAPGQGAFSTSYTPGQAFPLFAAFRAMHDYFSVSSAGTAQSYYNPVLSDANDLPLLFGVEALDSGAHVLLINKDGVSHSITVVLAGVPTVLSALAAYEVRVITM